MTAEVFAPAKINLTLHVTGQRPDGYHLLDSLVVFADFGDRLSVAPADSLGLTVSGPLARGVPVDGRNTVLRAAALLRARRGVAAGAALTLEKRLPHGAGIGGGSSDAAAAIRLLARHWNVPPLTPTEALELGADVPVCLFAPAPMFMRGIGDLVVPAPRLPVCWLVLVNPGIEVSTAKVFALHDRLYDCASLPLDPAQGFGDFDGFLAWLLGQRNDLTKVARDASLAPVVGDVLGALRALPGCHDADMSGSGSTCWGLFRHEADARRAANRLGAAHPDWWIRLSRL